MKKMPGTAHFFKKKIKCISSLKASSKNVKLFLLRLPSHLFTYVLVFSNQQSKLCLHQNNLKQINLVFKLTIMRLLPLTIYPGIDALKNILSVIFRCADFKHFDWTIKTI